MSDTLYTGSASNGPVTLTQASFSSSTTVCQCEACAYRRISMIYRGEYFTGLPIFPREEPTVAVALPSQPHAKAQRERLPQKREVTPFVGGGPMRRRWR
jgi:hypothetical protein